MSKSLPSYNEAIQGTTVVDPLPNYETSSCFKIPSFKLPTVSFPSMMTCVNCLGVIAILGFFCGLPFYWAWVEYWAPMAKMQSMQNMYQPCQCRLNSVSTTTFDFDVWCTDRHYIASGDRFVDEGTPLPSCLDGYIMDRSINQSCFGTKPSAMATAPLPVCFGFRRSDYVDLGAVVGGVFWSVFVGVSGLFLCITCVCG